MSQPSSAAILAVLAKHYTTVGVTIVNDLTDLEDLIDLRPDLVFLGMKFVPVDASLGRHGPRIWLADYLDAHDIAYTGSSHQAHELELDKHLAKERVMDAGLNTAPFIVVRQNQLLAEDDLLLNFPLFIKPTSCGGGFGVGSDSVAHTFNELKAKVRSIALDQKSDALIEEYLPGREFSVAILRDEAAGTLSVMPMELIAPQDRHGFRLLSGKIKSANSEQAIAVADQIIKTEVTSLALNVFRVLGARDYGRIDIRLDVNGKPHFLEANLLPSLISGYGSFPKACALNLQLDYEPMILSIVRLGLARQTTPEHEPAELSVIDIMPLAATA